MVCIHCGSKTYVINSRLQKRRNQIWRRRQCLHCKAIFTTEETPQYAATWAVRNKKGSIHPFNRDKLFLSLYESCQHRTTVLVDAAALTDTVIKKLYAHISVGTVDSPMIAQIAKVALNRFDKAASTHYQAFHK